MLSDAMCDGQPCDGPLKRLTGCSDDGHLLEVSYICEDAQQGRTLKRVASFRGGRSPNTSDGPIIDTKTNEGGFHSRSVPGVAGHVKEAARTAKTQRSSTGGKAPSGGPPQADNGDTFGNEDDLSGNGENNSNGNGSGDDGDGSQPDRSDTPADIDSLCRLAKCELERARSYHEQELMAAFHRRDRTDTDAQNRLLALIDAMLEDAEFDTMFADSEDIRDICHKIHVHRLTGLYALREVKIYELERKLSENRDQGLDEDEEEEEADQTADILNGIFHLLLENKREGYPDLESEVRQLHDRVLDLLLNIHSSDEYRNDDYLADTMRQLVKAKARELWITFTYLLQEFVERGDEMAKDGRGQSSVDGPGRATSMGGSVALTISSSNAKSPTGSAFALGSKRSACNNGDAENIPSKAAKKG